MAAQKRFYIHLSDILVFFSLIFSVAYKPQGQCYSACLNTVVTQNDCISRYTFFFNHKPFTSISTLQVYIFIDLHDHYLQCRYYSLIHAQIASVIIQRSSADEIYMTIWHYRRFDYLLRFAIMCVGALQLMIVLIKHQLLWSNVFIIYIIKWTVLYNNYSYADEYINLALQQ